MKRPIIGNDHNIRRRLCEKHGRRRFYEDGFGFTEEADREGCDIRSRPACDEPGIGGQQAFHRNGGLAGSDITCFRRMPLLKGDDIKSELGEACVEE